MKKTLVFDIDDTISIHKNRDYANAKPIQPVIDKLNRLHDEGYYIKLFTGRGQLSCNGDLDLIIKRNKDVLEKWLTDHNVKYDELIFGKPLGDWYIDDKGLSVSDFLKADFYELKGGSGSSVYREFDKVIKKSKTSQAQYYWYRTAKENGVLSIPHIYSCVGDTLYMEYVEGENLCDCVNISDIESLIALCYKFKRISNCTLGSNLDKYCDNLKSHLSADVVDKVISEIYNNYDKLLSRVSFCHGDLTFSNIIKRRNELVIFDPNYKDDYTSYLLDLSKMRQSLHDYEYLFNFSTHRNSKYLTKFDKIISELDPEDLPLVKLLDITHWIRMYDYKSDEDKPIVLNMINKLFEEYENEYIKK